MKKSTLYSQKDAEGCLQFLKDSKKVVTIVGYGNQGRSQALNMKDSGLTVIIGNRSDHYKKQAEKDGLSVYEIDDAVRKGDIIFLLIPDETMPETYEKLLVPNVKKGSTIVFASGYNICYDLIIPDKSLDVLMIAPRMIGAGVRERYLNGEGFISFTSVHQDATGNAKKIMLGLSDALGTLKLRAIDVTMKEETILDLFNEQGWVPAFNRIMMSSLEVLLKNGLPPEAVLTEMYLSEELSFNAKEMAQVGISLQSNLHSNTSQYGSMSRAKRYTKFADDLEKNFQESIDEIKSGKFAKEWGSEKTKEEYKVIKHLAMNMKMAKIEESVRKNLGLPVNYKKYYYEPEDIQEVIVKEELKEFVAEYKKIFQIEKKQKK